MAIVPLAWAARASEPFCDYLNVTVPRLHEEALQASVAAFMAGWGVHHEPGMPGLYKLFNGTIKASPYGKVYRVSASGQALFMLRCMGAYGAYLAMLGEFPHRVSMLHATCDYTVVSPPDVVQEVKRMAYAESINLTRKKVLAKHVKTVFSLTPEGQETGTVYFGQRANADVWGKVYDKHHEQLCRGVPLPPYLVRVEIAIQSDMGATLRDAFDPTQAYLQFAGRCLAEVPAGTEPWVGAGEGFVLPVSDLPTRTAYEQIEMLLEATPELKRLRHLAAGEWGDRAWEHVGRLIMRGATISP